MALQRGRIAGAILGGLAVAQDEISAGRGGFDADVRPFLATYCVDCHGPERPKAGLSLHELAPGADLEDWEHALELLEAGDMPPTKAEQQPGAAERRAVVDWIRRERGTWLSGEPEPEVPHARRLTNLEYENTMRDLLGFPLELSDNLPADPTRPYHFHNTAEFMLLGPDQIGRYLENARRAMQSAVVDPVDPEVHRQRAEWIAYDVARGMGRDEIGVYGNRRHSPHWGMGLKSWPATGRFRIRVQAAALLPPGQEEVPLRLVMGYTLNENSSTLRVEPVGTVLLRNSLDDPQVFEFEGRIENFPVRPGRNIGDGRTSPASLVITPQNLFDDGRLGDQINALTAPRIALQWMEFEAPLVEPWPPEHHTRILFDSPLREADPEAYVRAVLDRFLTRAFRRPATGEEVETYAQLYALLAPELGSLEATLRETLAMALISPQFLLHTVAAKEVATPQHALASRLSYFLWRSMPDAELSRLANDGALADDEVLTAQVRRLLADERAASFVHDFTTQWLSLQKLHAVKINTTRFPRFLNLVPLGERKGTEVPYRPTIRDYLHQETVGFVGELLRRNAPLLDLVAADFAYLNESLAAHYGVEGVQGITLRPVPVEPESHLGGLLTHASVLVANSNGTAPHPIYRAVWLREAILGDEVRPPPAEVPALSDSAGEEAETAVTIGELLAAHRQVESCNDCHSRLDPWGLPFEQYDATGRFRASVPPPGARVRPLDSRGGEGLAEYAQYLAELSTVEVSAESQLPNGLTVDGVQALEAHLVADRADDIVKNVARRLLAFGLGRALSARDRASVDAALEDTAAAGHRFEDVLIAICLSPNFRGPVE